MDLRSECPSRQQQESQVKHLFNRFVHEESGQDIIEYALLAAFISIVAWGILVTIGGDVKTIYTAVDGVTGQAATAAS